MSIWKPIFDYTKQIIALGQKTEKNAADVQEMRQQLKDLTATVQRLDFEMQRDREMAARDRDADMRDREKDRENLLLRLEVQLLRFERRLPPPPTSPSIEQEP